MGAKTESGKYSSKFALTELLVCGCCGTPYRRCTWTSHGTKRIVWRCISRLDYGKKYCQNSPTVEEQPLQNTIVGAICKLAGESSSVSAIDALNLHARIYFGGEDSIAADELRAKELVSKITLAAGSGSYTAEMAGLVKELNEVKQRIAVNKQKKKESNVTAEQLAGVSEAIESLRGATIQYDDEITRRLVDCVRVLSAEEIEIRFKGRDPQRYALALQ